MMDDFEVEFQNGNYIRAINRDVPHMTTAEANAVYEFAGYDVARAMMYDDDTTGWAVAYDRDTTNAEAARAYQLYDFYANDIRTTTFNDGEREYTLWVPHDEGEEHVIRHNRTPDISFDIDGIRFNRDAFSLLYTREELDEYNNLIRASVINDEDEQDLEDEKGGALDDFLDSFGGD